MKQECFDIQTENVELHPPEDGVGWANKLEQLAGGSARTIPFLHIKLIDCTEKPYPYLLEVHTPYDTFRRCVDVHSLFHNSFGLQLTYGKCPERFNKALIGDDYEPLKRLFFKSPMILTFATDGHLENSQVQMFFGIEAIEIHDLTESKEGQHERENQRNPKKVI